MTSGKDFRMATTTSLHATDETQTNQITEVQIDLSNNKMSTMKTIKITPRLIVQVILAIGVFVLVYWLMENLPDLVRRFSN